VSNSINNAIHNDSLRLLIERRAEIYNRVAALIMDIEGALKEVASSNDSKFGEDGKPIFNEQSKIMKGPHYQSPDLTAYTLRRTQSNGREV